MTQINCPIIKLEDYELQKVIAKGAFSVIIQAKEKSTEKEVAIKAYFPSEEEKEKQDILQGIEISTLNIPGIVKTIGYRPQLSDEEKRNLTIKITEQPDSNVDLSGYIVVMEFFKNGDLLTLTKEYLSSNGAKNEKMNPTIRSKIIFGTAVTLKQLHKKKVIHHDVKNSNVYLDDKLEPKLGDFELAKFSNQNEIVTRTGTPLYMAPELFSDDYETYSFSIDVYSFSILLYNMFTEKLELDNNKPFRYAQKYMMFVSRGARPKRIDAIPDHYWDLIQMCWKEVPEERPTFDQIVTILKDDKFALEEFGLKTNLDELHEYQKRIDIDV